ncbi:hypothetical protein [Streptomyces sannanensis]
MPTVRWVGDLDVRVFHEAVLGGDALSFPVLRRRAAREIGSHHEADHW